MISHYIGEGLIFLIGLPLFAFQTFEGFQALIDVFNLMAQSTYIK